MPSRQALLNCMPGCASGGAGVVPSLAPLLLYPICSFVPPYRPHTLFVGGPPPTLSVLNHFISRGFCSFATVSAASAPKVSHACGHVAATPPLALAGGGSAGQRPAMHALHPCMHCIVRLRSTQSKNAVTPQRTGSNSQPLRRGATTKPQSSSCLPAMDLQSCPSTYNNS